MEGGKVMQKAPILLASNLPPLIEKQWQKILQSAMPEESLITLGELSDQTKVEIALVANPPSTIWDKLPHLKWIQSLWAGVENLLVDKSIPDVPVCRLIDPDLAQAMAETVMAAVMGLHRHFDIYKRQQSERDWIPHPPVFARDRRVTILGLGEMGRISAARLASLGFSVRGWSRSKKTLANVTAYQGEGGLTQSVNQADILVNLLPLTKQTRGILNQTIFQYLAEDACLINFGRGAHLNEEDLLASLGQGKIRHAVLDVFKSEPLPKGHIFWSHPQVTLLPHIAATTNPISASKVIAQNIRHYRQTGMIPASCDRSLGY